ncbi:hypothetical protein UFOVP71_304 [uncultured Caudovirales phage]|uniref:Uncharacterized protein n=1 Tax=uncultured Caudovirales phage TaxID=2100421 RepID=A0A6J5TA26_9CAUD|nr:hypothetical protein UFOVP71_304 [uncultured Caudovirales phage]
MKQYRITAEDFNPQDSTIPDCYVDPAVLHAARTGQELPAPRVEIKSQNLGKYQQDNNIKPGTDAWFKLWFGDVK